MPFDFKNASKADLKREYRRIAAETGDDRLFTRKELNYLPDVLSEGEQVLAFVSGILDGTSRLVTLTQWRIIFLDKGLLYGLKQTDIELDKVYAVTAETGLVLGKIRIQVGSRERKVSQVSKKAAVAFANKVRDVLRSRSSTEDSSAPARGDSIAHLERLADLKERGVLTDAEFAQQKMKILQ